MKGRSNKENQGRGLATSTRTNKHIRKRSRSAKSRPTSQSDRGEGNHIASIRKKIALCEQDFNNMNNHSKNASGQDLNERKDKSLK
jgi:hypothetical protein